MGTIRAMTNVAVCFLLLLGLVAVAQHYVVQSGLVQIDSGDGFATQFALYKQHPVMESLHLIPAFLFFTIAPLQFISRIRNRHPRVHRVLGRTYVATGLISGFLGLLLSVVMPFGGIVETILVVPFAVYFLVALIRGFQNARARKIAQHRAWMIRALAVALAISLQRVFVGLLMIDAPAAEMPSMFNVAIGASFVMTIALAEMYVRFVSMPRAAKVLVDLP
jgi:uncharacterized membrane protein